MLNLTMDDLKSIRQYLYRCLVRREYTQVELRRKLEQRQVEKSLIDAVLSEFENKHYQSDARFAEAYLNERSRKGFGVERIRYELKEKGVSEELIDSVISNSEINWNEWAQKVRQKKFGSQLPQDFESKMKQMQFLKYRGFDSDSIKSIFEK